MQYVAHLKHMNSFGTTSNMKPYEEKREEKRGTNIRNWNQEPEHTRDRKRGREGGS